MLFRRWNNRKSRSTKDKEYRQTLLASILSFEEDVVSFIINIMVSLLKGQTEES